MISSLVCLAHLSHLVFGAPKPAQTPLIWFKEGALSATAIGTVEKGNTFDFYAVKGDFLVVNIIPLTKNLATSGIVKFPSGRQTGSHGGIIESEVISEGGRLRVEVGLNTMAETVKHGKFQVEIVRIPGGLIPTAGQSN